MKTSNLPSLQWFVDTKRPLSIWLKISVILAVAYRLDVHPTYPSWAVIMILVAAFLLVPIGYQEFTHRYNFLFDINKILAWHLLATLLLAISFILEQGLLAGLLALPYFLWCLTIVLRASFPLQFSLKYLCGIITWGFLTNAATWLVFDRFDLQPFEFSPWIVLLTGAHFHYAGFALMASLSLLFFDNPNNFLIKTTIWSVISGVVLTALGITTTQLGLPHFIETIAAVCMALSGVLSGFVFIKFSFKETGITQKLWLLGGFCLLLGMILAFCYAIRPIYPIAILTIPFMQAVHGSLNALGFGTLTLVGFGLKKGENEIFAN
jgi:YndJ-like protein